MKVEIWSDVVCPFCYIGKRKFEQALEAFGNKEKVEVIWRSFQLDPEAKYVPGKSVSENLAQRKGISLAEARQMGEYVTGVAKEVGLYYDFDKAVVTNSMDAHRLTHLALKHSKQNETEEALFAAYYSEGKNLNEHETLIEIGESVGLNSQEIKEMLQSERFKDDVLQDQYEAQQVGVRGVPFFVFNNKYAVSGAQPTEIFLQTLEHVSKEFSAQNSTDSVEKPDSNSCDIDENC